MVNIKKPNEIHPHGDTVVLVVRYKGDKLQCLIDAEDLPKVAPFTWQARKYLKTFYIQATRKVGDKKTSLLLHRFLLGVQDDHNVLVDHINRNTLDNRKQNLRALSAAESAQNKNKYSNSTSRYRGVSWHETNQKWVVKCGKDRKIYHLGYFTDEDEAGRVAAEWRARNLPYAGE